MTGFGVGRSTLGQLPDDVERAVDIVRERRERAPGYAPPALSPGRASACRSENADFGGRFRPSRGGAPPLCCTSSGIRGPDALAVARREPLARPVLRHWAPRPSPFYRPRQAGRGVPIPILQPHDDDDADDGSKDKPTKIQDGEQRWLLVGVSCIRGECGRRQDGPHHNT